MNAIQGTYADFKIVKSRSVAQFIIEIPIEHANDAVATFGLPDTHVEKWVAIAQLNQSVVKKNEDAAKAIQQAGILCRSKPFGEFLKAKGLAVNENDTASITDTLRSILGIRSRSDFHNNQDALDAFYRLKGEFDASVLIDDPKLISQDSN